jgi:uncharacterized protein
MATAATREAIKRVWATFATRDAAQIAACFTADAEWIAPEGNGTAKALAMTHHMRGASEIADFIAHGMRRLFADVSIRFIGMYCDGDTAVAEEEMTATLPGGKPYKLVYCFVFVFRDGLVARVREYMDTQSGERQIRAAHF